MELRQLFINEITASDAGPDIIRSHLFVVVFASVHTVKQYKFLFHYLCQGAGKER